MAPITTQMETGVKANFQMMRSMERLFSTTQMATGAPFLINLNFK
jgi:hypothetical protein